MSVAPDILLKQSLRKLEFPLCAKEALVKIGELVCARVTNIKHMDFCLALMSEFLFYEIDRRGNKRTNPLTAIAELQLIEVLYEYFTNLTNESTRNTVFLSLFTGTTANQRIGVLSKLVSIAAGIPCPSILISATAWMQQLGNNSEISCKLAEALVVDYFILTTGNPKIKLLPDIAPQFIANFLTATAENYFVENGKDMTFPPLSLLETVTYYISNNSSLCIAAQQQPPMLPPGAIAMESNTPIAGLLRWCVLAPLYNQNSELYVRLHLALLDSILEIPYTNPPKAISAQSLSITLRSIMNYVAELKKQNKNLSEIIDHAPLKISLDRQAQAIQVALFVKCVYGKVDELVNYLQILPYNKLMKIVIITHKQIK
ncbi:uncharacterized protein C7orf26 [Coccinella septempunctata]|uniref:uncharacterized protein C7orf26 n=1 Tax=Coccinella septempunctata TaxID=41139 RepID=UPI001D07515D|nr:uncharacterized protein C7orf26 [Coccinella septempunctata]